MDYEGRFIMQKTVDWSLLNDGMPQGERLVKLNKISHPTDAGACKTGKWKKVEGDGRRLFHVSPMIPFTSHDIPLASCL